MAELIVTIQQIFSAWPNLSARKSTRYRLIVRLWWKHRIEIDEEFPQRLFLLNNTMLQQLIKKNSAKKSVTTDS